MSEHNDGQPYGPSTPESSNPYPETTLPSNATPVPPQHTPPPAEPAPTRAATGRRRRRVWPAVVAAGLLGGSLGSLGTAYLVGDNITPPTGHGTVNAQQASAPMAAGTPDWSEISDQVRPSVVALQVQGQGKAETGSGVVIDDSGRIMTNNHVVEGADKVQVMMKDGRIFQADILGTDQATDLAIVQLKDAPDDLQPADLGTSSELVVGQPVMAVGNPLGLDSTVTTGIISALERPVMASETDPSNATVTNAIQIDAAINPGNSGGPLFNAAGQVIGINSSIATTSKTSGSVGLGFAIPIDLAHQIAEQLITEGKAEHAFLGVSMTDGAGSAGGVTRMGAHVEEVDSGTPAAEAGIQPGDVIVGIDGRAVGSAEALTGFVREYRSGDEVDITLIRSDQEQTVTAVLASKPEA